MVTLDEARDEVQAGMEEGITCPCCGQFAKLYKRKLTGAMARWLILLTRRYNRTGAWVDISKMDVRGGDYAKLMHWQLVDQKEGVEDPSKRTSGMWMPTEFGIRFVNNQINVPSHVHIFNNTLYGWSNQKVSIIDCLGTKFDYSELMSQ